MFYRPLIFQFPYFIPFWIIYLWAMAPEMRIMRKAREEAKKEGSKDAGSVNVIFIVGQVGLLCVSRYPLPVIRAELFRVTGNG